MDGFHFVLTPDIGKCLLPDHSRENMPRSNFGQMIQAAEASDFPESRSERRLRFDCEGKRKATFR
jgi:hypothetical protein